MVAPSMFAVYLLHQPRIGLLLDFVKEHADAGWNIYVCSIAAAVLAFVIAVLVDLPRRFVAWLLRSQIHRTLEVIDCSWFAMIERVENGIMRSK